MSNQLISYLINGYDERCLVIQKYFGGFIASTKETLPNRVVVHVPKREKSRNEVVCRCHLATSQ